MGQRCRICDHPNRPEIDRALVAGQVALAKIARGFMIGESNLYRHKRNCVALSLALAEQSQEEARGRDLRQELLKLSRRAERLADEAERKGQLNAAISAIRELSRLVALEATFYPPATRGKISIEQIQQLITSYDRGGLQDLPDDAIVVEALPAPDEE